MPPCDELVALQEVIAEQLVNHTAPAMTSTTTLTDQQASGFGGKPIIQRSSSWARSSSMTAPPLSSPYVIGPSVALHPQVVGSHTVCVPTASVAFASVGRLTLPDGVGQVRHPRGRLRADQLQGHAARVHALEQADSGAEQHG